MIIALLREAAASARSQLVASVLTFAVVAGMCVAVLLTTGRTVAAEEAALGAIDAAGTRSIIVRASDDTSVTATVLDRLASIDGIEAVAGFGPITDVRNAAVPGGEPVASRLGYGDLGDIRLVQRFDVIGNAALASPAAVERLGLRDGVGAVADTTGVPLEVVGTLAIDDHLRFMDPVVIVPSSTAESLAGRHPDAPLALLVILAEKPGYVAVLTEVIQSLLADADREFVTVETSAQFAAIRSAVAGELGQYGHETILGILAVSAFVVGVNLLALVMMRRKDFGRRRALGARRGMIIGLLLCQVGITAGLGALIGSVTTAAGLAAMGYSLPGAGYIGAVAVLAILSALAAAVPPALYAASRDPLH
jgi:putative ABC transport system permease protein